MATWRAASFITAAVGANVGSLPGVADVPAPVVAEVDVDVGAVDVSSAAPVIAEVDVGAVDVSSGLGRAAEAGLGVDVLKCSRCLGPMRLIACIEEPDVAKKILEHLGLRAEPLPTLRAQAPPVTLELFPAS